ncbi:MAG: multidrug efflux pump, partial [Parvicellaceae bacterium]
GLLLQVVGSPGWGNLFLLIGGISLLNLYVLGPGTKFFQNRILPGMERRYFRFLTKIMRGKRSIGIFFGAIGLLIASFVLFGVAQPNILFFPENQPQYINVFIEQPVGTEIVQTNETTLKVKALVDSVTADFFRDDTTGQGSFISSVIEQVGKGTSDPMAGPQFGNTPHKARITIAFTEFQNRQGRNSSLYKKMLDDKIANAEFSADVKLVADKNPAGPPQEPPVNIEITGPADLKYIDLLRQGEELIKYFEAHPVKDIAQLKMDVETGKAELPVVVDKERAKAFGVSTSQVAMSIRTALFGKDIATYKKGDKNYDVALRFGKKFRGDIDALLDQKMIFMNNRGKKLSIPIRSVVYPPKKRLTFGSIKRKNLTNMIVITSGVTEGANANAVVEDIKGKLKDYLDSDAGVAFKAGGFNAKFTGQMEQQGDEAAFLFTALAIAVFLILLIIVTQFNSYSSPVIILTAVVLSLIGVFLGLVISGQDFIIIMTMIGIISLAGIVVNNAIVLLDYTNLLRKEKKEELGLSETEQLSVAQVKEAIIKGGQTRLRPVLLTAITTVLGLLPMAIGINIDFIGLFSSNDPNFYIGGDNVTFFGAMSWTIIYGLTFATFLTLIIVPVTYYLLYRFKRWIYRIGGWTMRSQI